VVNASEGRTPAAGAEVLLRVNVDGQFVIVAETITGADGKFLFEPLPIRADYQYLPGANRDGCVIKSLSDNLLVVAAVFDVLDPPPRSKCSRPKASAWAAPTTGSAATDARSAACLWPTVFVSLSSLDILRVLGSLGCVYTL